MLNFRIRKTINLKRILILTAFFIFFLSCTKDSKDDSKKSQEQLQLQNLLSSTPFQIDSLNCQDPPSNDSGSFNCELKLSGGNNAFCGLSVSENDSNCNIVLAAQNPCSAGLNNLQLNYSGTCNGSTVSLTFKVTSIFKDGKTESREKSINVTF